MTSRPGGAPLERWAARNGWPSTALAGKLDARARVDHLLDAGSFRELGTLAGDVPADAIVAGAGRIGGRPVMIGAEDFTTVAGTIGGPSNAKRYRLAELALRDRIPLLMLLEGAGHRQDGRPTGRAPVDLLMQAQCSGNVPVLTAVLGASAGHGALIAPMSDFAVMSEHSSVFTAGPPVVAESLGEIVTKDELGGPGVAVASGLIHNVGTDDPSTLDLLRIYLSYFPSSAWSTRRTTRATTPRRATFPSCSTSSRATAVAPMTCAM